MCQRGRPPDGQGGMDTADSGARRLHVLPRAIWWLLVSLQRRGKRGRLRLEKAGSSGLLVTTVTSWQMEEWELGDQWAAFGGSGLALPGASRSYVHSLSPVPTPSCSDQQIQAPAIPENQEPADRRDGSRPGNDQGKPEGPLGPGSGSQAWARGWHHHCAAVDSVKPPHLSEPQFPSLEMVKKQNFLSGSWEGSGGGWILSLFPLSDGETCPSVIARKWQGGIHTQAARPPAQARPDTE